MSGDTPISETDAIFARAYANAIKTKFQLDIGQHGSILTSPVTQRGIAAGDLIYPQMTNYLIYKFADGLQYSDNPIYTGVSAGSYIRELLNYIAWNKPTQEPSQEQVNSVKEALDEAKAAENEYDRVEKYTTEEQYDKLKEDLDLRHPPFNEWKHELLAEADKNRKDMQYKYVDAMDRYGSVRHENVKKALDEANAAEEEYDQLEKDTTQERYDELKEGSMTFKKWEAKRLLDAEKKREAARAKRDELMKRYPNAARRLTYISIALGTSAMPGYNQNGLVDNQGLIANVINDANNGKKALEQLIAQSTVRVPAYTIANYVSTVQAWIIKSKQGATRDQVITIDIKQGRNTKWEDYGFKEVRGGSNIGPFFSAEVHVNGKWESRTLKTKGREDDISLQLAMIGIQKFDIRGGEWDVPNIKDLFPDLLLDAPDALSSKFARIVSVLVGYDVELKVDFASSIKEEVNKIYEEVKTTGGRMSIFGFRVSAGASGDLTECVETKFENVKWDRVKGSMSLTPTKGQVYPTILGAVTQRFD